MADWKLSVALEAKRDVTDAFQYYRREAGVEIARSFRDAVRAGMRVVGSDPMRWPVFDEEGARRYLIRSFPYGIIYDVDAPSVTVLAVMHLRRKPGYFRG